MDGEGHAEGCVVPQDELIEQEPVPLLTVRRRRRNERLTRTDCGPDGRGSVISFQTALDFAGNGCHHPLLDLLEFGIGEVGAIWHIPHQVKAI